MTQSARAVIGDSSAPPAHPLERYSIAALVAAAFLVRVIDLDFNGPFIDESYYSVAVEYGNWPYITGDVYLWPLLAYFVNKLGGILAVRFVAALFGTLTVWFVYRLMRVHARALLGPESTFPVALGAAVIAAVTPPFLVVGTMAVYDSMALMLFTLGLWMTTRGIEGGRPAALLVGGLCLPLAAATRYAIFLYLPIAGLLALFHAIRSERVVLRPSRLRIAPRLFLWLAPFLLGSTAYVAAQYDQIRGAAAHATKNAVAADQLRPPLEVFAQTAGCMTWPACLAALLGLIASLWAMRRRFADHGTRVLLLAAGTLLVVVYQAFVRGDVHQMAKNLALALLFGGFFVGVALHVLSRIVGTRRQGVLALGLAVALGAGLWMDGRAPLSAARHQWPDVRPAVDRALALGLDRAPRIWCTSDMFVWQLRAALPHVEIEATWKFGMRPRPDEIAAEAVRQGVHCVVGPMELTGPQPGASVADFIVRDHIDIEGVWIHGVEVPRCYFLRLATGACEVPDRGEPAETREHPFTGDADLEWLFWIPAEDLPGHACRITRLAFKAAASHEWAAKRLEVRMVHSTAARFEPPDPLHAALGPAGICLRAGPIRFAGRSDAPCTIPLGRGFGYDGRSDLLIHLRYFGHAGGSLPVHHAVGRARAWHHAKFTRLRRTAAMPVTVLDHDRRCVLTADRSRAAPGEPITYTLTGGQPGDSYVVAAAFATTPDGRLAEDALFARSREARSPEFRDFTGTVDAHGRVVAALTLPAAAVTGARSVHVAAVTVSPNGRVTFSNVATVRLGP